MSSPSITDLTPSRKRPARPPKTPSPSTREGAARLLLLTGLTFLSLAGLD